MVFSLFLSFLRFLIIIPRVLWHLAGMKRAVNRGKRKFKKGLIKNGLPKELAEELVKEYVVLDEMLSIRRVLKFAKASSWHTVHNTLKPPKAR